MYFSFIQFILLKCQVVMKLSHHCGKVSGCLTLAVAVQTSAQINIHRVFHLFLFSVAWGLSPGLPGLLTILECGAQSIFGHAVLTG